MRTEPRGTVSIRTTPRASVVASIGSPEAGVTRTRQPATGRPASSTSSTSTKSVGWLAGVAAALDDDAALAAVGAWLEPLVPPPPPLLLAPLPDPAPPEPPPPPPPSPTMTSDEPSINLPSPPQCFVGSFMRKAALPLMNTDDDPCLAVHMFGPQQIA